MNANENKFKTKLIIFDFDGTLTKPDKIDNSWARIWNRIGLLGEDERLYKLYKSKKLTYRQWVDQVIEVFRQNKVDKSMFASLAKEIKLLNNCKKVFKIFYEKGIKICILSGGVKNIIDEKVKKFNKYITDIEAGSLTVDDSGIVNGFVITGTNIENKSDFILQQMRKYNLKKEEIIFVGNSFNDEDACKSGVTTICINPFETNYQDKTIWTHYIKQTNDLSFILPFINF